MDHYLNLPQTTQRTREWYNIRSQIITSTQVASILHLNSHRSYDQLLKKNQDAQPPLKQSKITRRNVHEIDPITWGSALESVALQHLEQTTQCPIGELGLKVHDNIAHLGASPDGIQIRNGQPCLVEIKCPKYRQITYRVPLEYWIQVQIAMEVWDIDQVLYCEYKFDITSDTPSVTDLTLTYGQLGRGVYWIYQDSWRYLIHRDREWFSKVRYKIDQFYQLKFSPVFSAGTRKRKLGASEMVRSGKFTIKERIPVAKFVNYLQEDPILDWLDYHKHDYPKDKNLFLNFFNQVNLKFKLSKLKEIITIANQKSIRFQVLNPSINNLLDVYHNNLLLKIPYDHNVLEETQSAMDDKIGVIIMGQLSYEINGNHIWETFDLIIRKDLIGQFVDIKGDLETFADMNYIPIKLKYISLEFNKDQMYLRAKHNLEKIKMGLITSGLIIDRKNQVGVIKENHQPKLLKRCMNWFRKIPTTKLEDLHPNMKNRYDLQWASAKSEIAKEAEELTQVAYLNVKVRNKLHQKKITRIDQLNEDHLDKIKHDKRIIPHLSNNLHLPKLKGRTKQIEIYLDFENCSSLGTNESIIFLMGILVKKKGSDPEYHPFLVDGLTKSDERKMIANGLEFIGELCKNVRGKVPIYHWSHAEPVLLRNGGYVLPNKFYWIDLYKHFLEGGATIPGCYTYGLKNVAKALHKLRKINSCWLHGLDGNSAMVMAWNIWHKCSITGDKFSEDQRIIKLCDYNYVDCQVLLEIRNLL